MRYMGIAVIVLGLVCTVPACSGGDSDDSGATATTGSGSTTGGTTGGTTTEATTGSGSTTGATTGSGSTTGSTTGGTQCPEDYSPIACCKNGMMDMCCCIQEGCEEFGEYKKCGGGTCVIPEDPERPPACP